MKRHLIFATVIPVLLALVLVACAAPAPAPTPAPAPAPAPTTYSWRLAHSSPQTGDNCDSVYSTWFKEEMEEWSNGQIEITIYPNQTLGTAKEQTELVQSNDLEFNLLSQGDLGTFVPEFEVFAIHYLWPVDKYREVMKEVISNGKAYALLQEISAEKNLIPLGYGNSGWMYWSSNKPIQSLEDMKGWKIRVMPSDMLVEAFKAYGANPTPLPWGELYTALEQGLVEGQSNPLSVGYAYGFWEVQKYFTNAFAECLAIIPVTSAQFMDSLPKEISDKVRQASVGFAADLIDWRMSEIEEGIAFMLENRPEIEITEWTQEQTLPLRELSKATHPIYIESGGPRAAEVLQAFLDDIENAKKKFGVD